MIEKIKQVRVHIDGLSKLVGDFTETREISESYKSLLLGKAWLGKVLAAIGVETPYIKDGNRHNINDIEPTADTAENIIGIKEYNSKNYIEKLDYIREDIVEIVDRVEEYLDEIIDNPDVLNAHDISRCSLHIHQHLSEARFWLGFELGKIRDSNITETQVNATN